MRIVKFLFVLLVLGFGTHAQVSEPHVIFKEQNPVIKETLTELVDINTNNFFQDAILCAVWLNNGVIYFSNSIPAQVFSFTKFSFKNQEYFAFKSMTLDSTSADSLITMFQPISDYPSCRYIKNWGLAVDGNLYQVEIFNDQADYQLKTYSGIKSNLKSCPEAQNLNSFFSLTERLIFKTTQTDPVITINKFHVDYEFGQLVPELTKEELKALEANPNVEIKMAITPNHINR